MSQALTRHPRTQLVQTIRMSSLQYHRAVGSLSGCLSRLERDLRVWAVWAAQGRYLNGALQRQPGTTYWTLSADPSLSMFTTCTCIHHDSHTGQRYSRRWCASSPSFSNSILSRPSGWQTKSSMCICYAQYYCKRCDLACTMLLCCCCLMFFPSAGPRLQILPLHILQDISKRFSAVEWACGPAQTCRLLSGMHLPRIALDPLERVSISTHNRALTDLVMHCSRQNACIRTHTVQQAVCTYAGGIPH